MASQFTNSQYKLVLHHCNMNNQHVKQSKNKQLWRKKYKREEESKVGPILTKFQKKQVNFFYTSKFRILQGDVNGTT